MAKQESSLLLDHVDMRMVADLLVQVFKKLDPQTISWWR